MNRTIKMAFVLSLILPTSVIFAAQPVWSIAGAQMGVDDEAAQPAQFIPTVPEGKEVLIGRVEWHSLAASPGLIEYDVLLGYGDRKRFAPDQLSVLVAADRQDRAVTLKLVRSGKLHKVQAEPSQDAPQPMVPQTWRARPFRFPSHAVPGMHEQRQETVNESFESLCIQKLENGRYRAALEYLGADGNKRSHVFEGTREELRNQIGQSRGLPAAARRHLLNALNMNDGRPMPRFWRPLDYEELMRTWREGGWMQY